MEELPDPKSVRGRLLCRLGRGRGRSLREAGTAEESEDIFVDRCEVVVDLEEGLNSDRPLASSSSSSIASTA